jgi:hypothetical protein
MTFEVEIRSVFVKQGRLFSDIPKRFLLGAVGGHLSVGGHLAPPVAFAP